MGSMSLAIVLSPGGIIAWLVVVLIAGGLAGLMIEGKWIRPVGQHHRRPGRLVLGRAYPQLLR